MVTGLAGSNKLNGGDGDDTINGGDGFDFVNAGDGDDLVSGGAGDDLLHGNDGFDTAIFSGLVFDYSFSAGKGNSTIVGGADGTDTLKHFEALQFDDYTYFIDGRNNGPFTRADTGATNEDESVNLTALLDNDIDIDDDSFSITSVTSSGSGATVAVEPDGSVTYDPNGAFESLAFDFLTTDTFTYTVTDSNGGTRTETVTMTITGANDDPTADDVAIAAVEDGDAVTGGFAGDDIDSDNDVSSLIYAITSDPDEGDVINNGNGSFTFDPGSDFQDLAEAETRDVTFNYTATDSHGAVSEEATVTVTVTEVDDGPVIANPDSVTTSANSSIDINVLANDVNTNPIVSEKMIEQPDVWRLGFPLISHPGIPI